MPSLACGRPFLLLTLYSAYIDIFANGNPGQRGNLHPHPRVLFITELIISADSEAEMVRNNKLNRLESWGHNSNLLSKTNPDRRNLENVISTETVSTNICHPALPSTVWSKVLEPVFSICLTRSSQSPTSTLSSYDLSKYKVSVQECYATLHCTLGHIKSISSISAFLWARKMLVSVWF